MSSTPTAPVEQPKDKLTVGTGLPKLAKTACVILIGWLLQCSALPFVDDVLKPSDLSTETCRNLVSAIIQDDKYFASPKSFSWVAFDWGEAGEGEFACVYDQVAALCEGKLRVYAHPSEIPESEKVHDEAGNLLGYVNGFEYGFRIRIVGRNTVEIDDYHWVGNIGAEGITKTFELAGSEWLKTEERDLWMR